MTSAWPEPSVTTVRRWGNIDRAVLTSTSPNSRVLASPELGSWLIHGDVFETLDRLSSHLAGQVSMIFADPPYFMGLADWDRPQDVEAELAFAEEWLAGCRTLLADNGSLWVSGSHRSLFTVGYALRRLGMRPLSHVVWEKPTPRPTTHRSFVHSTESLLWAAKRHGARYRFNYECMRRMNGGKQMHSLWRIAVAGNAEKSCGRHPAQKPLALVERCILATTGRGDLIVDPFSGSGTAAVAARNLGRACIGIDEHRPYLEIAKRRLAEGDWAPASSRAS
jgi:site-specific DNA-methyltransferase (adenine-specific)